MSAEPTRVILFVDLLGVRSRWLKGGRDEAEKAFKEFRTLIAISLKHVELDHLIHGLVESDAMALTLGEPKLHAPLGNSQGMLVSSPGGQAFRATAGGVLQFGCHYLGGLPGEIGAGHAVPYLGDATAAGIPREGLHDAEVKKLPKKPKPPKP